MSHGHVTVKRLDIAVSPVRRTATRWVECLAIGARSTPTQERLAALWALSAFRHAIPSCASRRENDCRIWATVAVSCEPSTRIRVEYARAPTLTGPHSDAGSVAVMGLEDRGRAKTTSTAFRALIADRGCAPALGCLSSVERPHDWSSRLMPVRDYLRKILLLAEGLLSCLGNFQEAKPERKV